MNKFISTTLTEHLKNNNGLINSFDKNKLEKLYHNTYLYNGIIDTYHLSTIPNLEFSDKFKSERGGDGDYIYSSLEYQKWLEVFDKESLGENPSYLYIVRLTKPKYKPGFSLFGVYTPHQFLSNKDNTEVIKYVGRV